MRTREVVTVKKYDASTSSHRCDRSDGTIIFVDFFVSGKLKNETPESIVGRSFDIDAHDYCLIANEIYEVPTPQEPR